MTKTASNRRPSSSSSATANHRYGAGRSRSALHGIWEVDRFVADGEVVPPLVTDEVRWRRLVVDREYPLEVGELRRPGRIAVQGMDGGFTFHPVALDEEGATITRVEENGLGPEDAGEEGAEAADLLRYELSEPGKLVLRGSWQGRELEIEATHRGPGDFELTGRGFHWINEVPRNR